MDFQLFLNEMFSGSFGSLFVMESETDLVIELPSDVAVTETEEPAV